MDEELQRINDFYNKALQAKGIAIKSDRDLDQFLVASDFYNKAVCLMDQVIAKADDSKINFNTQIKALREYYLFELNECLYAF